MEYFYNYYNFETNSEINPNIPDSNIDVSYDKEYVDSFDDTNIDEFYDYEKGSVDVTIYEGDEKILNGYNFHHDETDIDNTEYIVHIIYSQTEYAYT